MPDLASQKRPEQQQELFSSIAERYDLLNHLMTGWQDKRWRRAAVQRLELQPGAAVLDIGSGGGQIIEQILHRHPDCRCTAADLTWAMMSIGQTRLANRKVTWVGADAASLPFSEESFDGVISGFLVRNLEDVLQGLREQHRVLKPGGRIAVLDTTKPPQHFLGPVIKFHMKIVIPTLGSLLTRKREAYHYLTASTEDFLRAEELAAYLAAVGFKKVAYQQMTFGVVSVHWGEK